MAAVQPRQGQTVLFCMAPALVGRGHFKRELCQSVCSSAICLIRRRRQTCGSTCRASAYLRLSSCPWTAKRAARAASPSWTTRIARSPRRRSSGSTSNHSRDEAWRSARPGRAKTVRPAPRAPADSAAHGPAATSARGRPARPAATARRPAPAARVRSPTARSTAASIRAARRTSVPTRRRSTSASRTEPARAGPQAHQGASGQPSLRERRGLAREGRGPARHRQHRDAQGCGRCRCRRRRRGRRRRQGLNTNRIRRLQPDQAKSLITAKAHRTFLWAFLLVEAADVFDEARDDGSAGVGRDRALDGSRARAGRRGLKPEVSRQPRSLRPDSHPPASRPPGQGRGGRRHGWPLSRLRG